MYVADALTGGYIAGLIGAGVCVIICLVWFAFGVTYARGDRATYKNGRMVGYSNAAIAFICLLAIVGVWIWASWPPFAYDYHHWVDKTAQVEAVSKRQVASGESFFQKFVVRDAESGELYGIDDTRAALIKIGDTVKLRCKKAYQFGVSRSAHGWDCRWAG